LPLSLERKKHSYVCTRIKGWGKEEKERERGRMSKRGKEREREGENQRVNEIGREGGGGGDKEDGIQKIQKDRKVEIVRVRVEEGRERQTQGHRTDSLKGRDIPRDRDSKTSREVEAKGETRIPKHRGVHKEIDRMTMRRRYIEKQ